MQPLRIRIDRIVDFGTVVSLVGIDTETALPVIIHVDHRPFAAFWKAWWEAGLPQPVEYATDRLMLHLDMMRTSLGLGMSYMVPTTCGGSTIRPSSSPMTAHP